MDKAAMIAIAIPCIGIVAFVAGWLYLRSNPDEG